MKNLRSNQAKEILDLISTAAILTIALTLLTTLAFSKETVQFKGKISAGQTDLSRAIIVVEVEGKVCISAELQKNGEFEFELPTSSIATMHVIKDGFTSKEVSIDTDNIWSSKRAKKKNKTIVFEVELLPRSFEDDLVYAAPVGRISFLRGSGLMKVEYDQTMIEPVKY